MDKILVTGGAGYIGSHIVKNLVKEGIAVIILDNFSSGFIEPIEILKKKYDNLELVKGDLSDKELLVRIFQENQISTVMHLAAKIEAAKSVQDPELYHQENYVNSINLVEAMTIGGVNQFIFSSTAAVYGDPEYIPIDENHPANPNSPYGQTKLDFEKYLTRVENLKYIIFRYFNVGGSDPDGLIGKSHLNGNDLIENIMKVALGQKGFLEIYGNDYDTPDGTPVRDLIHVDDIAQAHILALKKLEQINSDLFNLGSENGFTLKEIVDKGSIITGGEIRSQLKPRRLGDIEASVASAKKAKEILRWDPKYSDLETIIQTDWNWRKKHPLGYTK